MTIHASLAVASGVILALLLMLGLTITTRRKMQNQKNEIQNFNALRKAFIDAGDEMIYLKDDRLQYAFVNKATVNRPKRL